MVEGKTESPSSPKPIKRAVRIQAPTRNFQAKGQLDAKFVGDKLPDRVTEDFSITETTQ
jgi:hypothetical protein